MAAPPPLQPPSDLVERARRLLGGRVGGFTRAPGGYTLAERWRCHVLDGPRAGEAAFLKGATDTTTAAGLRAERVVYAGVSGSFLPRCLGFLDEDERPLLALEDLSHARWPPPWRPGDVEAVRRALAAVAAAPVPPGVPDAQAAADDLRGGWERVAQDPRPFLALGLASEGWLARALPALREASAGAPVAGSALLHQDVRSDNLCLLDEPVPRAVLVDWNWALRGDPRLDAAFWAPSLASEGGPPPEALLGHEPGLAALVAGTFAAVAGLPADPPPPRVREVQRRQLATALPWAARALGLPPPGADAPRPA